MLKKKIKDFKKNFGHPKKIFMSFEDIKFGDSKFKISEKNSFNYDEIIKDYDWQKLEDSIVKKGYKPNEYSFINISKDGYCIDGHHRLVVLRKLGINNKIEVKQFKYNYWFVVLVSAIYNILTLNFKSHNHEEWF